MELISDADGNPAPRLGDLEFTPEEARSHHAFLVQQVVRMLCAGLVHGDLSEYNVLVDPAGPVIIDLPQAVNAMGNNHARAMLLRDVANITGTLARFVPELAGTHFGEEMWARFEEGSLAPDTLLTGTFTFDETPADVAAVQAAIDDAREEALRRELARQDQDP
jgi:RIO kinase 1